MGGLGIREEWKLRWVEIFSGNGNKAGFRARKQLALAFLQGEKERRQKGVRAAGWFAAWYGACAVARRSQRALEKGLHRIFFAFGSCGNARTLPRFIPSQSGVWVVDLWGTRRGGEDLGKLMRDAWTLKKSKNRSLMGKSELGQCHAAHQVATWCTAWH